LHLPHLQPSKMRIVLFSIFLFLSILFHSGHASPYREDLVDYNLNTNKNAQSPLEYDTTRPSSNYTPSPDNWRALPVYTLLLDKFSDGDPSNNDFFGTPFETDYRETQLRFGGDLKGLVTRLDYLYGMGVRIIFISGTPFLNMIWQADSQSFFQPCSPTHHSFSLRLLAS
jgi:alpha-1,3-glucan synthase